MRVNDGDYFAKLTIQNGRMVSAMRDAGIDTASELARRSGVCPSVIGKLLNFRMLPRTSDEEWRIPVRRVCDVLGLEPIELFPDHLQHEVVTNHAETFVSRRQLSGEDTGALTPYQELEHKDMMRVMMEGLDHMSKRDRQILTACVMEGGRLNDVSRELRLTPARIRQLRDRAIRRLRSCVVDGHNQG